MKLHVITKAQEHNAAQVPTPPPPQRFAFMAQICRGYSLYTFTPSPLILPPSLLLSPSLHLSSSPFSFVLAASLARPCGRAFEGSISNTSKGFLSGSWLFQPLCICTCVCFCCTIHASLLACPYIWCLLFSLLSVRWKLLPRGQDPSFPQQYGGQDAQIPSRSVPSLNSRGPSICSGCCGSVLACYARWLFFSLSPLSASHARVSISLAVVCPHAVVPNFCLCLFPPSLVPEHMY